MLIHPQLRTSWPHLALASLPGVLMLLNAAQIWERVFGLAAGPRQMLQNFGLLFISVALCVYGYWRERRLPLWSFPALGIALAIVMSGAATSLLLFPVGVGIVGVAVAAALGRPIMGRAWDMWLVDLLVAGGLLAPLVFTYNSSPPVESADTVLRFLTAAVRLPQAAMFVSVIFGLLPAVIGWRLAAEARLLAGLVPASTLLWFWAMIGDPAYALGMWTDNRALVDFMSVLPALTLLVVVSAVMLGRSRPAQWCGFLLPVGAGLLTEVVVDTLVRPYATMTEVLITGSLFFVPLVAALWLCSRRIVAPALPAARL